MEIYIYIHIYRTEQKVHNLRWRGSRLIIVQSFLLAVQYCSFGPLDKALAEIVVEDENFCSSGRLGTTTVLHLDGMFCFFFFFARSTSDVSKQSSH